MFLGCRWTYADPSWARIAALVPQVVTCAEAGDEICTPFGLLLLLLVLIALLPKVVADEPVR